MTSTRSRRRGRKVIDESSASFERWMIWIACCICIGLLVSVRCEIARADPLPIRGTSHVFGFPDNSSQMRLTFEEPGNVATLAWSTQGSDWSSESIPIPEPSLGTLLWVGVAGLFVLGDRSDKRAFPQWFCVR